MNFILTLHSFNRANWVKSKGQKYKANCMIITQVDDDSPQFSQIKDIYIVDSKILFVTGFWKTNHFVTFEIINNSVYLAHFKWYYWFNNCLHQSQTT